MRAKLISTILAATMAIGLLAGCGQETEKEGSVVAGTSQSAESSGQEEKTEQNKEPIIITWYMQKPLETMEQQEEVEEKVNEVIYPKTGAKIEFHFLDSAAYNEKMNVMISSGEEFDICFTTNWTNDFLSNARRGAFADISDMLEEYAPDILEKVDDYAWKAVTIDGGIYAIPGQAPYSQSGSFVFKKELVEKYDFDYESVKTIEDLEPFFELLKANEPGITPALVTGRNPFPRPISLRYTDNSISGLTFDEDKQEFVKILEADEEIKFYETMYNWYNKGYIAKDAAVKTEWNAEATSGKYAVTSNTGSYSADGEKSTAFFGFECVETYNGNTYVSNGGILSAMNAISATSKNPEKALEVLNLIWADPEISNTIAYGIEGINYTIDEERTTADMKSIIPTSGDEQTWAIWHNWVGPLWDQWDSAWNRVEALKIMQEDNERAGVGSTFGFYFDASELETELAAVSAVMGEIKPVLNTGSMPDFEEYIQNVKDKFDECGLDMICEEANRQYKEWKAGQ